MSFTTEIIRVFIWPLGLLLLTLVLFIFFFSKKYVDYHPILEFINLSKIEKKYWPADNVHKSILLYIIHRLVTIIRALSPLQYLKVFFKVAAKKENSKNKDGYLPSFIKEIYILLWLIYDFYILFIFESISVQHYPLLIFFTSFQIVQVVYSCLYYNFFRSAFKVEAKVHNFDRSIVLILFNYFEIAMLYSILFMINESAFNTNNNTLDHWYDALYFSISTITTLGYGDVYPNGMNSKLLVSSEVLIGTVILVIALARIVGSLQYSGDYINGFSKYDEINIHNSEDVTKK